jgi:hypothetical protein
MGVTATHYRDGGGETPNVLSPDIARRRCRARRIIYYNINATLQPIYKSIVF